MDVIVEFFKDISGKLAPYRYIIWAALIFSALLVGGITWQQIGKSEINEKAHMAMLRLKKLVDTDVESKDAEKVEDAAIRFVSSEAKWKRVRDEARKAYDDLSSSGMAPFIKAYESDALLELGDESGARRVLSEVLVQMLKGDLYDMYKVKLALMKIDSVDENKSGLAMLKEVSSDTASAAREVALYRLGEYFWGLKEFEESKNYWGQLVFQHERAGLDAFGRKEPSNWVTKAKAKLALISHK